MSQKKVDAYKSQKANRAKIVKKEKMERLLETCIGFLLAVVVVVWIGYSVYDKVTAVDPAETAAVTETVIDTTALDDYVADLNEELAE